MIDNWNMSLTSIELNLSKIILCFQSIFRFVVRATASDSGRYHITTKQILLRLLFKIGYHIHQTYHIQILEHPSPTPPLHPFTFWSLPHKKMYLRVDNLTYIPRFSQPGWSEEFYDNDNVRFLKVTRNNWLFNKAPLISHLPQFCWVPTSCYQSTGENEALGRQRRDTLETQST